MVFCFNYILFLFGCGLKRIRIIKIYLKENRKLRLELFCLVQVEGVIKSKISKIILVNLGYKDLRSMHIIMQVSFRVRKILIT